MPYNLLLSFMLGSAVTACVIIGAFFVAFWTRTRDRLFLMFSFAFWLFGVNWLMVAIIQDEIYPSVYLFRLLGFVLIIVGIIGKNRSLRAREQEHPSAAP